MRLVNPSQRARDLPVATLVGALGRHPRARRRGWLAPRARARCGAGVCVGGAGWARTPACLAPKQASEAGRPAGVTSRTWRDPDTRRPWASGGRATHGSWDEVMRFFVGFFWEVVRGESERGAAFFTFIGWDGTLQRNGNCLRCVLFRFVCNCIVSAIK